MADRRCNCDEPDCPICTAPAHMPWTPKPGVSPPPPPQPTPEEIEAHMAALRRWERWLAIRRYLLVLLLALLGGMIGGMTSAITILLHFD
jgi:hypothetical protein